MRVVGLDIHRSFAEAAMIDEGRVQQLGRIDLVRERVIAFAKRLGQNDRRRRRGDGQYHGGGEADGTACEANGYCQSIAGACHRARKGQDRQDRCRNTRQVTFRRIPTGGLAARREHGTVTSSGRSAGDDRAVAYAGEEPGTERAA